MDQERHHHGAIFARSAVLILLGAHLAEHDRIDDFEMRGIGGQRQMNFVVVELAIRRGAEVIFDVARALDFVRRRGAALEFMEDGAMRLGHHLRQHVEPAAMGHADDDLAHAERAAALDDLLQRRNHRLAAVETEALGAGEFQVAEFLEALGLDQLVEDGALAFAGESDLLVRPLDAFLDPALLRAVGDVQEFDAERLAIGAPQDARRSGGWCRIRDRAPCRERSAGRDRLRRSRRCAGSSSSSSFGGCKPSGSRLAWKWPRAR